MNSNCREMRSSIYGKKGSALVTVMVVFIVLMIVSASVTSIFSANLYQAKQQEHRAQAYYLALSGIDLGLSALLVEDAEGNTLLDKFKWDAATYPNIENDLAYKEANVSPLNDVLNVDSNTISLSISAINTSGKREVKLISIGSLDNSSVTYTLVLIIDSENPANRRWE